MKKYNNVSPKYNFKKIVKYYIIFFIATLLLSVTLLGYAYRDKLIFAYNYDEINENILSGKIGTETIKSDISSLAKNSNDVVDILLLDDQNNILFSAKNSDFASNDTLTLESKIINEHQYLVYMQNSNLSFKLIKAGKLITSSVLFQPEKKMQKQFKNDTFFENNSNKKTLYLLSYTTDKVTGNKVYVISDIHPVKNGQIYIGIVAAVLILFIMSYLVLVALWVYRDARKSKINALLWGIITLFTNIAGLFVYLIYKQNSQVCHQCGALQNKTNIYCIHCGNKINKTCKNCSTITNEGDNFCHHCGVKIDDDALSK